MLRGRLRLQREWLALASLAILACLIWLRVFSVEPQTLRAVILDVGQADSIYLRTPSGKTVLVDGGGRSGDDQSEAIGGRVLEPFLRRQGINRIDLIILTHPHDDHLQGLLPVVRDFRVGMVIDPMLSFDSETYARFKSTIRGRRIKVNRAVRGQILDFGDGVRAEILHPPDKRLKGTEDDINNNSMVVRFTYENQSLLLMGDAGAEGEENILHSKLPIQSDVIKIGHHGSDDGTSEEWLDAVHPTSAVISVGRHNSFGHPSRKVLDRLAKRGIKIYRTDKDGAVEVEISPQGMKIQGALDGQSMCPETLQVGAVPTVPTS